MNLPRLCVALVACVAVTLSLSACVFTFNGGALEPPAQPETYDEWVYWTAEPKLDVPADFHESLRLLSDELGLGVVFEQPSQPYFEQGWVGVAQYGSLCIIALGVDAQTIEDSAVSIEILSRYDQSLTVTTTWSADYEAIRTGIEPFTEWCKNGGPIPMPTDGGQAPPEEPTTDA